MMQNQVIKPTISPDIALQFVSNIWGFKVEEIHELDSYDDRNFHVMVNNIHRNPFVSQVCSHGYVLKILNRLQSSDLDHIGAQNEMMLHLNRKGFKCPIPTQSLTGEFQFLHEPTGDRGKNLIRLLTYIPGNVLSSVPLTGQLMYDYGKYVGQISNSLSDFHHDAILRNDSMWFLTTVPKLRDFLYVLKDDKKLALVESVISAFEEEVTTRLEDFRKGTLHGDMHDLNVLIAEDRETLSGYKFCGLLDFSDIQHSCIFFEVAVGLMDIMNGSKVVNILDVGGHVLAGYLCECKLDHMEWDALKVCVAARYCQALVMGQYNILQDPSNDYVMLTAKEGWGQLQKFWDTPKQILYSSWEEIIKSYSKD